jgi:ABC-type protease/lipase transport system fused ATPase/permease subunit
MGHWRPFVGAIAVIALFLISPLLGLVAFIAAVIAALIFWVSDGTSSRPCPRCGEQVPNGVLSCEHCQFDFNTIGSEDSVAP